MKLGGLAGALVALALTGSGTPAIAGGGGQVTDGILGFRVKTAAGGEQSLGDFRGKTLLVVNTASKCGFTPQYKSLEALYEKYKDRGLVVLAFPANDFLHQEPGTDAEIQSFCSLKYGTTFPVFAKISVKGRHMAPLYAYLTRDSGFAGDIEWNFTKFLVGPDGRVVARFGPKIDPLADQVTERIAALLPAK